jgi:predicted secreted hydrolase
MMRVVRVAVVLVSLMLGSCGQDARVESGVPRVDTAERPPTPARATRIDALSSEGMPGGFALATEPRAFEFPRDHGPHPEFRHEWWYVTGHLDAASGEHFGFELTFFRFALLPPSADAHAAPPEAANESAPQVTTPSGRALAPNDPASAPNDRASAPNDPASAPNDRASAPNDPASAPNDPASAPNDPASAPNDPASAPNDRGTSGPDGSAWRTRQIYMAHFAVTDLDRGTFVASEHYARDALGLAGAQSEPFRVWLDDWSLGTPVGETGPEGSSYWRLRASDKGYDFDLQLRPVTPPVLNGDAGLSRKSDAPGAASYYYSIPRLATMGRIVRDGRPLDVQGLAWLDREWGSGSLGSDQQGWDWFALQLDDGSTLMFYALRKQNGARDPHSAGTWFAPDGTTQALANEDVQIDVKDFWDSPRGARYPSRWQLRVPKLKLDVDIRPRLADQELALSTRYWEGAALINGTRAGNPIGGRAYVELVGYANSAAAR